MTGKRGPKTKPKSLSEPGPLPDPPDWLEDATALEHWHRYGPTLNKLGLLESLDGVAFALLCDGISGYLTARDQLTPDNLVEYVGESHHPTQNPLVSIVRQQTKAIREFLGEFGMTPQSRTQLTGSTSTERNVEELDPLEALAAQFASAPAETPAKATATPAKKKRRAKKKATPRKKKPAAVPKKKAAKKKTPRKKTTRKK